MISLYEELIYFDFMSTLLIGFCNMYLVEE